MTIWNAYEKVYDRLWVQRISLAPTRTSIIDYLAQHLEPQVLNQMQVLDVSCGTGQLMSDLKANWPTINCMGLEPSTLGERAREKGHSVFKGTIDALETSFDALTYDLVTCTHAFPYYPDQPKALALLSQRLKPGGLLMVAHAETATPYDALMLLGVKLTTSKARYPRPRVFKTWLNRKEHGLVLLHKQRINAWGIPSITLYIARKCL